MKEPNDREAGGAKKPEGTSTSPFAEELCAAETLRIGRLCMHVRCLWKPDNTCPRGNQLSARIQSVGQGIGHGTVNKELSPQRHRVERKEGWCFARRHCVHTRPFQPPPAPKDQPPTSHVAGTTRSRLLIREVETRNVRAAEVLSQRGGTAEVCLPLVTHSRSYFHTSDDAHSSRELASGAKKLHT